MTPQHCDLTKKTFIIRSLKDCLNLLICCLQWFSRIADHCRKSVVRCGYLTIGASCTFHFVGAILLHKAKSCGWLSWRLCQPRSQRCAILFQRLILYQEKVPDIRLTAIVHWISKVATAFELYNLQFGVGRHLPGNLRLVDIFRSALRFRSRPEIPVLSHWTAVGDCIRFYLCDPQ